MKINEKIVNAITGDEEVLVIELSDEQIAEIENSRKLLQEAEKMANEKAAQKADLLARLGITEEEAKLLLS